MPRKIQIQQVRSLEKLRLMKEKIQFLKLLNYICMSAEVTFSPGSNPKWNYREVRPARHIRFVIKRILLMSPDQWKDGVMKMI